MLRCYRKPFIVIQAMLLATVVFFSTQSAYPTVAQAASTTVTINPAQQYQTIQGWGTSLAWWANIIGGWSDSQRTALADALYDPSKGIGLNVARYNFGADGPGNTCESQITAGRNVPSFEPTQGNYVWTNDANQLWFAQAAKARGANIFEGFVNSAPAWMLLNSCTAGGTSGQDNLSSAHYNDFASYIATIAQHFHDSFGITLQTVEPFNEPLGTWWTSSGTQEGMYVSRGTQNTIIPLVVAALAQNGASAYTSVSAPDDNTVTWPVGDYTSYSSSTIANIAQWNTHSYGGSDSDRAYAYAHIGQGTNKRLWMSEWGIKSQGTNIGAALALSHQVLDDEQALHPAAWVAWHPNDNFYYTATSLSGPWTSHGDFAPAGTDTWNSQTTFVLPIAGSSTTTYMYMGDRWCDACLPSSTNVWQPLTVSGTSLSLSTYYASWSLNVSTGTWASATDTGTSLNDATTGTGIDQFNYFTGWTHSTCGSSDACYDGDNTWSTTTNATATVTFTGTQINVYAVLSPVHGLVGVELCNSSGGSCSAETLVNLYAPLRAGNQLVWVSPVKSSGTYMLKLIVPGAHDNYATSNAVTVDRVTIS